MSVQDSPTDDPATSSTLETPSCLMLLYSESTPIAITAHLPNQPVVQRVGSHVTLGRSGSADIRLNDERMSRLYAALWHDGNDPFVFRVSNLSQRKLLTVDGAHLRHLEESEVKDGSVLTLDFLELRASVRAGDYVAENFQVSFKSQGTLRQNGLPGRDLSSVLQPSERDRCESVGSPGESVVDVLVARLQAAVLDPDAAIRMNVGPQVAPCPCPCSGGSGGGGASVGCGQNVLGLTPPRSSSLQVHSSSDGSPGKDRPPVYVTSNNLPPNIPLSLPPSSPAADVTSAELTVTPSDLTSHHHHHQSGNSTSARLSQVGDKGPGDGYLFLPVPAVDKVLPDLASIAQRVQRALAHGMQEESNVCPGCCHDGGGGGGSGGDRGGDGGEVGDLTTPSPDLRLASEMTSPMHVALADLRTEDPDQLRQILSRSPVEHEDCEQGECDSDDPNINAYI